MDKKLVIKASAVCNDDSERLKQFSIESSEPDKLLLPKALRRRAAMTTRMAVTAAKHACERANEDPAKLTSVFASVGGEIQVTDALCRTLPDTSEPLSPTQFHNSVHNTTAGYWSILNQCRAATTAIAGSQDTFAMGLLESWSQLQQNEGVILLVCYDELWPQYLQAPLGRAQFASAWVLALTPTSGNDPVISLPQLAPCSEKYSMELSEYMLEAPAASAIPLLGAIHDARSGCYVPLTLGDPCWQVHIG